MKLDIFKKEDSKICDRKYLEYKTKIVFRNLKTKEIVKVSYTTTPIENIVKLRKIAYISLAAYVKKQSVYSYGYSLDRFNYTELKMKEYEVDVESI